ncbi:MULTISPECIES: hypothetical protein [unclassified Solwaraspora]|uniref:hypothetical protein n=1 Tax=unclassified Solwaraspora TaxID=2627926 RepID=UPI00248B249B|nr:MULTISPECIES: hypothetical protein [unclassified Solwaraspora]WBB99799.1 hypothetical protein O7553_13375 [Solwaraspora sp. WMMA2059]WBC21653.1 hypothetical protein O7543_03995 [Solwaraspora sp. WMMA2080]WJK36286.1 hypothetical protein O7610_08020 [Solwaraspora sp. WMMA2065]
MPDPTEPDWRPDYTGDNSLGDVGAGRRLGAHLYYLYRAGRNELPEIASVYARLTRRMHSIVDGLETQFDRPGLGMHPAHLRLMELRDEAHDVFRQTCLRMQEVGAALVDIADSYAATDELAADEFSRLLHDNAEEYGTSPPHIPELPGVHDPPPSRPTHDGRIGGI